MSILHLPLKRQYFEQISSGEKSEEYRLITPYWEKRLEGRTYTKIKLTLGYPSNLNEDRIIYRPWRGFLRKTILHPHFGSEEVKVFAIIVN